MRIGGIDYEAEHILEYLRRLMQRHPDLTIKEVAVDSEPSSKWGLYELRILKQNDWFRPRRMVILAPSATQARSIAADRSYQFAGKYGTLHSNEKDKIWLDPQKTEVTLICAFEPHPTGRGRVCPNVLAVGGIADPKDLMGLRKEIRKEVIKDIAKELGIDATKLKERLDRNEPQSD